MSKKNPADDTVNSKTLSLVVEIPYTRDLYQGVARIDCYQINLLVFSYEKADIKRKNCILITNNTRNTKFIIFD